MVKYKITSVGSHLAKLEPYLTGIDSRERLETIEVSWKKQSRPILNTALFSCSILAMATDYTLYKYKLYINYI